MSNKTTNPNDEETGTSYYLNQLGYEVVKVRPNGPTSSASYQGTEGSKVTSGGQVLVSAPIEQFETREREGQELAGVLENRILRNGGVEDAMRGHTYEMGARFERAEQRNTHASEDT